MLTNYSDRDDAPEKEIEVKFAGFDGPCEAEVYLLDAEHDLAPVSVQRFSAGSESFSVLVRLGLYGTALVKVRTI